MGKQTKKKNRKAKVFDHKTRYSSYLKNGKQPLVKARNTYPRPHLVPLQAFCTAPCSTHPATRHMQICKAPVFLTFNTRHWLHRTDKIRLARMKLSHRNYSCLQKKNYRKMLPKKFNWAHETFSPLRCPSPREGFRRSTTSLGCLHEYILPYYPVSPCILPVIDTPTPS